MTNFFGLEVKINPKVTFDSLKVPKREEEDTQYHAIKSLNNSASLIKKCKNA